MNKLKFGAEQAVRTCLKVRPGEAVVLITDQATREVGDVLFGVVRETTPTVARFVMEDFGERPDDGSKPLEFPRALASALCEATVSIFAAQSKRGEIKSFRTPMLRAIEANRLLRHAHMINVTEEVMKTGMSADYEVIRTLSAKVHDVVKGAGTARVTSNNGTDFTVKFNPNWKWIVSDGQITKTRWKNLPDGEVYTCAESAQGRAVIDGCVGDHFGVLGSCEAFPVTLDIQDGIVTRLACPAFSDLEKELNAYIHQDEHANRVGEFGIGTNIGIDRIIGNMLQDEKFPGMHISIGHGYPEDTGSPWHSDAHVDMVIRNVTIQVDDRTIMKNGTFVI